MIMGSLLYYRSFALAFAVFKVFLVTALAIDANENQESFAHVTNDRYRLNYHIMAGWINDPNGFSYYNDEYHVFFQHNPYAADNSIMHWGHVKSSDLVHWKHLSVALSPGDTYYDGGCFSGSAVDNNGVFTLIYTGNAKNANNSYYSTQNQNIATSTDGENFEKYSEDPVIRYPPDDGTNDFRDPRVWKHGNLWYVILGNASNGKGRVLLYKSENLINWEYVGVIATSDGTLGYMWECPDFFDLGGKYVLTMSPQGIEKQGDKYANLFQTGYLVGSYLYENNNFSYGDFKEFDHGHDFYALQTTKTPDGRRVAIAWMDMWESSFPEKEDGWAGALTIPRELVLSSSGKIIQKPVSELENLRTLVLYNTSQIVSGNFFVGEFVLAEILIDTVIEETVTEFGILLNISEGTKVIASLNRLDKTFTLDRGDNDFRRTEVETEAELRLRIFLDKSSIEIFIGEGEETFSSRIYPTETPVLSLFSKGDGVANVNIIVYELKSIWEEDKSLS